MESFVYIDGKKYRRGYTTGSTAAAASLAAAQSALNKRNLKRVEIDTPKGIKLGIEIESVEILNKNTSRAVAKKDGGDDIDITNNLEIVSEVKIIDDSNKISIHGGNGVGIVTKKGLSVEVGKSAINPVPLKMIESEVRKVIGDNLGAEIIISVPKGEKAALKTFNPKLGVMGGISIIGTTGIVEPMSEEAWRKSLSLEMKQKAEYGLKEAVFVFGNYGEKFVKENMSVEEKSIVKTSNFIGYMLKEAVRYKLKKVYIIGHIGKLVKVSGGIFNTHSKVADARMDIICSNLLNYTNDVEVLKEVYTANTTEEAIEMIDKYNLEAVFDELCLKAKKRAEDHVYDELEVETLMFSMEGKVLGSTFKHI